jgi:DNA-binding transcriptional LysR family regulator
MSMLDPRLSYLVTVARLGSFTAAASATGVTQSAVTKSIADLEKEIGYSIFYRTSRGVILTEEGRDLVDRVARLLEDTRELLRGPARGRDPYSGILRIGVGPASLEWWLVEPLATLLRRHPGIRYDITSSTFEAVVQQLRSGTIDVAIGFDAAFSEWSDFRREPMGELKVALFVRKGHALLELENPTLADLAQFDFVSPSDSRPYGQVIRSLYEDHDVDWQLRLHKADYFPIVRSLVAASDAIGVVALPYADSEQFGTKFGWLTGIDPWPTAPLCCAVRARWEPKPAVRAFISTIQQSMPPVK